MKVLLVTTKGTAGGAQVFVADLAHSLTKLGQEMLVAAGAGEFLISKLKNYNISFRPLKSLTGPISLISLFDFIREIRRVVLEFRPDVVHLNSSHVLVAILALLSLSPRPKLIFTMHGLSVLDPNYEQAKRKKLFYKLVYSFFLKRLDETVYISQQNMADRPSLREKRTSLIYNGFSCAERKLDRAAQRQEISRLTGADLSQTLIVASIGRLAYQKNYEFLISNWPAVLADRPTARLVIFGHGEEEAKLRALIKKNKLEAKVYIINIAPAEPYLAGADFYLQSSRYEGLPYSLFEAMAAGLPILASDVGGIREMLLSDQQLFPLNDGQAFIERLNKALEDKVGTAKTAQENQERLKSFSLEKMAEAYLEVYRSL